MIFKFSKENRLFLAKMLWKFWKSYFRDFHHRAVIFLSFIFYYSWSCFCLHQLFSKKNYHLCLGWPLFENKNKGDFIEFHVKSKYLHSVKFFFDYNGGQNKGDLLCKKRIWTAYLCPVPLPLDKISVMKNYEQNRRFWNSSKFIIHHQI